MNSKNIIKNYLSSIISLFDELSESEFKKMESGDFKLSLKLTKVTSSNTKKKVTLDKASLDSITEKLKLVKSREKGIKVVESNLKSKAELELFAKHIDVAVMSSDKVLKIKEGIVDATVGARLRAGAIQGKEI